MTAEGLKQPRQPSQVAAVKSGLARVRMLFFEVHQPISIKKSIK
jgi:hypothetical protein